MATNNFKQNFSINISTAKICDDFDFYPFSLNCVLLIVNFTLKAGVAEVVFELADEKTV